MRLEKHINALQKGLVKIQISLENPRCLVAHQRNPLV